MTLSKRLNWVIAALAAMALALTVVSAAPADAGSERTYRVTITNLTSGQPMTPFVVAAHSGSTAIFNAGSSASAGLQSLAENGGVVSVSYGSSADIDNRSILLYQSKWGLPGLLEPGDLVGAALAVGDFNRDGCDDLAIGAPGEDVGDLGDAGAADCHWVQSQPYHQQRGGGDPRGVLRREHCRPRQHHGDRLDGA